MKVYTTSMVLLGDQFNYRSSFETEDGTIYLDSIDGFIAFNPRISRRIGSPICCYWFLIVWQGGVYRWTGISVGKEYNFLWPTYASVQSEFFSFRVTALDFQAPKTGGVCNKLDGLMRIGWRLAKALSLLIQSSLRWLYLQVKVANSDGVWNDDEVSLKVHILPPFYLSIWAYFVYALLIISCSLYTVMYFKRRSNSKHRRQMEKFEQEKEREVYHAKIDFLQM